MPYKFNVHRIINQLVQPWVIGYRPPIFWNNYWHMVDIDDTLRPR
jgi:hypothetical protein